MIINPLNESQAARLECEQMRIATAKAALMRMRRAFDLCWSNQSYTPPEYAALLGTGAADAFACSAATAQYIATIAPELIPEIPQVDATRWQLDWQPDGSLLIMEIIPPAPEEPSAPTDPQPSQPAQ